MYVILNIIFGFILKNLKEVENLYNKNIKLFLILKFIVAQNFDKNII